MAGADGPDLRRFAIPLECSDSKGANCMSTRLVELDGLRGIAIALVVLFHFGLFPPGWVGVQLFFVLSGYLISDILLTEKGKPFPAYLSRFYWRRSLRIFPLYFFYLIITSALFAATNEPKSFEIDWPFLVTYTTNFGRLRVSDVGPAFSHLWSLAVEEQFYLLWPLAVYFCSLASLRRIILATIVLSPVVRAISYFAIRYLGDDRIGRPRRLRFAVYAIRCIRIRSCNFSMEFAEFPVSTPSDRGSWTVDRVARCGCNFASAFCVQGGLQGKSRIPNVPASGLRIYLGLLATQLPFGLGGYLCHPKIAYDRISSKQHSQPNRRNIVRDICLPCPCVDRAEVAFGQFR